MRSGFAIFAAFLIALTVSQRSVAAPATYKVSFDSSGGPTDGYSSTTEGVPSAVSADGRYVAFVSEATDLVLGDTNGQVDVFVKDRQTGVTERVSLANDGNQASGGESVEPAISADGRYVAFSSLATNLVSGDNNNKRDIFVRDRQADTTKRVSIKSDGSEVNTGGSNRPSISADGRYVVFDSSDPALVSGDTNGNADVFLHDLSAGTTGRVSVSSDENQANNGGSSDATISADSRYVAFKSGATDLVSGDSNANEDIFVRDLQAGTTERVSVRSDGTQATSSSSYPFISSDGRYITFTSSASNLVSNDGNGKDDVFVRDLRDDVTERVSLSSSGSEAQLEDSQNSSISADGRYVVFYSKANNLVSGDSNATDDVFMRDRQTGTTVRVSVATDGSQATDRSQYPSISADGRYVAFESDANNLVSGDSNMTTDIFIRRLVDSGTSVVVNATTSGATASFDGSGSYNVDGLSLTSFAWDFGDGTSGQGSVASHTYAKSGVYQARLTVTDSEGVAATKDVAVSVTVPPVVVPVVGKLRFVGKPSKVTRKGRGSLKVACPKGTVSKCKGTLKLRAKLGKKTVTVASKKFVVAAGKQVKVTFKLSKKALRVIKRKKRLKVSATAQSTNKAAAKSSNTRTLMLALAKKK